MIKGRQEAQAGLRHLVLLLISQSSPVLWGLLWTLHTCAFTCSAQKPLHTFTSSRRHKGESTTHIVSHSGVLKVKFRNASLPSFLFISPLWSRTQRLAHSKATVCMVWNYKVTTHSPVQDRSRKGMRRAHIYTSHWSLAQRPPVANQGKQIQTYVTVGRGLRRWFSGSNACYRIRKPEFSFLALNSKRSVVSDVPVLQKWR